MLYLLSVISKAQIKFIVSLREKKHRVKEGLFIAEGPKVIRDLIDNHLELQDVYATNKFEQDLPLKTLIDATTLKKISSLKTPNKAVAVFKIPTESPIDDEQITICLDQIRDPGNLGTIMRTCDWFGIQHIVCDHKSVDQYNSKVVQSAMGSTGRISITYTDLQAYLLAQRRPIYRADMQGESIYNKQLEENAIIVFGNEANGISQNIKSLLPKALHIPRKGKAESLNLASSVAIMLSHFTN